MPRDERISELDVLTTPNPNDLLAIVNRSVVPQDTQQITVANFVTGGIVAPADPQYVTLAAHAGLTNERILTGTANQIIVTDGGAGLPVTLSLPQNIDITATPTFGGMTLEGPLTIDVDNIEALLVRKDGAAGDVFIVDTIDGSVFATGMLGIGPDAVYTTDRWFDLDGTLSYAGDNNGITVTPSLGADTRRIRAAYFRADVDAGITAAEAFGVRIADSSIAGGGAVTIGYGLYIETIDNAGTNYATYTNDGLISLGDDLQFRQASIISTTAGDLDIDPSGNLVVVGITGVDFDPSGDVDLDLLTVGVTGLPRLWWDESADAKAMTNKFYVGTNAPGATQRVRFQQNIPGTDFGGDWETLYSSVLVTSAVARSHYGLTGYVTTTHSSGIVTGMYGMRYFAYHTGAGHTTTLGGVIGTAFIGGGSQSTILGGAFGMNVYAGTPSISRFRGVYITGTLRAAVMTDYHGVHIESPTKTTGTLVNLYGVKIESLSLASTINAAIYTGLGILSLGDDIVFRQASIISSTAGDIQLNPAVDIDIAKVTDYTWAMGDSAKDPTSDAPVDWVEVEIAGTVRYLPAYAA